MMEGCLRRDDLSMGIVTRTGTWSRTSTSFSLLKDVSRISKKAVRPQPERQAGGQSSQFEIEFFRERRAVWKIGWIENLKLFSLLSFFQISCHR